MEIFKLNGVHWTSRAHWCSFDEERQKIMQTNDFYLQSHILFQLPQMVLGNSEEVDT